MTVDQPQGPQDAAHLKGGDDADDAERALESLAARPTSGSYGIAVGRARSGVARSCSTATPVAEAVWSEAGPWPETTRTVEDIWAAVENLS
jgi:hypothetical protein